MVFSVLLESVVAPNKTKKMKVAMPKIRVIFFRVISPLINREKAVGLTKPTIKQTNEARNKSKNKLSIVFLLLVN